MIFICFTSFRLWNYELKWIFIYLAFVKFKNFKFRSIVICFSFICFSFIRLDGTINLNESLYIWPLSYSRTLNLDQSSYVLPYQIRWNSELKSIFLYFASVKFCNHQCRNPSFGLATKAKGLQGCGLRGGPKVTSHTPGSARKCEGMNPHTPKATPTLEDGVPVDSRNFRDRFEGSNLNGLWRSLYHWKALGTKMSKMGSHCSFGHLKHKLWPKERPGIKLPVWLPTRKS